MPERPAMLDGVKLSPGQAALFEKCTHQVKGVKKVSAVCAESFRKAHHVVGAGKNKRWVRNKSSVPRKKETTGPPYE